MNIVLIISYDGTNYNGFQKQQTMQNGKFAIQNHIDEALSEIYNTKIETIGASRTDAKVHALHQVVMYEVFKELPFNKLPTIINQKLPEDIRVTKSYEVPSTFHPRYSTCYKTYEYNIYNGDNLNPLYRNFTLHIKETLNIDLMNEACLLLLGTHDFKGFSNVSDVKSTVRTIYYCSFTKKDDFITFVIKGDGFLYNMVRIIVATLIDIGKGKKSPIIIEETLQSLDRKKASATQKAHPLVLKDISYEEYVK